MKNMRLGVKLTGGFIVTALIVIAVGLSAIVQQQNLQRQVKAIGAEALPAVENILSVKAETSYLASMMRTLMSRALSREQRQQAHQEISDTRKRYEKAKKIFTGLPVMKEVGPEWHALEDNIKKWVEENNKVIKLSEKLMAEDILHPQLLQEQFLKLRLDHYKLLVKVRQMLAPDSDSEPFAGGEDHTACRAGKWMKNPGTKNKKIIALIKQLYPIHKQFHEEIAAVKRLHAEDRDIEAGELLERKTIPKLREIFRLVEEMDQVAEEANNIFETMGTILLVKARAYQTGTYATMDTMVTKVNSLSEKAVEQAEDIVHSGEIINYIGMSIGAVISLGLGLFLTLMITKPIGQGVGLAETMADGDMTRTLDIKQKDEIGALARSLNTMATNLRTMITDVNSGVINVDDSANQLAAIAGQMASGAADTAARSSQVAAAAEEMSANQNSVAAAMEEASVNITMVATAAEEMNSTISEIAQNSGRAKDITGQAVDQSQTASARVNELGRAAAEINKVTETITEISEQTNLLALNATIEAARAGEAGKGFAVVANEIKDLARQTADATLDIKNKVGGIQKATDITVQEINQISTVIADVDQIVASIATAVEEQTATTREIAENVSQASTGISEVNENVAQSSTVSTEIATDIAEVNNSASEMQTASSKVTESASQLAEVAEKLKVLMERFTV
ncbi:MAG: chemotaxis protein [Desulfobulbus propionicus]|nr:MAG: chemotaxis protein [Desulfobulbus propionicus]